MVAASLRTEHAISWRLAAIVAAAGLLLTLASPVAARNPNGENTYAVTVLQSNTTDADLVNGWGITAGPPTTPTPWWVSDNGTDKSTLYRGDGTKVPLTVGVPGGPTGTVFNLAGAGGAEIVPATDLAMLRSPHHELLRLQACYPRYFATQRYIVDARLVAVKTGNSS